MLKYFVVEKFVKANGLRERDRGQQLLEGIPLILATSCESGGFTVKHYKSNDNLETGGDHLKCRMVALHTAVNV